MRFFFSMGLSTGSSEVTDTLTKPETDIREVTSTLEIFDELVIPYEDSNDSARRTHIVNPPMNYHIQKGQYLTPQQIVDIARLSGLEVVALCGYRWVPKHNPEKFDICDTCIKIAGQLIREGE